MEKIGPSGRDARDPVTGLPVRTAFRSLLEVECQRSARNRRPFGLILFDIDRFKVINYGFGEQHGEALLTRIATLTQRHLRPEDSLSRWGGQEFLCLLPNTGKSATETLAEQLRAVIAATPVQHDNVDLHVTASFASASFPDDGESVDRLLGALGAALHQAKATGRNRLVAAGNMRPQLLGVGNMLSRALSEGRVVPAYQPIVDLKTGEVVADEALARILSPNRRIIPASAFIEAANVLQLTNQFDHSILLQTFERYLAEPQRDAPLVHFMNISGDLLRHPDRVAELLAKVASRSRSNANTGRTLEYFILEVTEGDLVQDLAAARRALQPFLNMGLRLALNDFGSGHAAYKCLADLPFAFLKIEGELIRRAAEPRVRTLIKGIQRTASELGLMTLAEYIETEQIANIVREIGIDWGQGYYFGKPVLAELPSLVNAQKTELP